jgi:hypothetical protein
MIRTRKLTSFLRDGLKREESKERAIEILLNNIKDQVL